MKGRLIIQFAANDPVQLADASELAKPWVDGIDLNCGACALVPLLVRLLTRSARQDVRKSGRSRKGLAVLCCASRIWCGT